MSVCPFRCFVAVLLAVAVLAVIATADEVLAQATPIQITAGDTTTLELDGNPSTGYTWVLQDAPREFVSVDVLGFNKPALKPGERPLLGAPKKFQVLVTGIGAGRVVLVFNYMKAGTPAPAKTQEFAIEVLDSASPGAPSGSASDDDSARDLFAKPDDGDEQDGGGNDNDPP